MDRRSLLAVGVSSLLATGCGQPIGTAASVVAAGTVALPLPTTALRKIGFGSCLDQGRPKPIFNAILADKPDLFVFGGDNVYASTPPWSLDYLRKAYQTLASDPGFARLRETVPHVAIWDDHDYGVNDGGVEFAHKQVSKDAFIDFWALPVDDPRRQRAGLYHSVVVGPEGQKVQLILLDGRWFRSPLKPTDQRNAPGKERFLPDSDPSKTMLGSAQWEWLEAQLRVPADLRLIVSGVQVIVEGHGWESWGNFPHEQARLFDTIRRTQAKGVVLLSGDRHIGAIYRHLVPGGYPLFELTSSGLTHAWAQAKEVGPNRLGELVTENHYATVEIDWPTSQVHLLIKSMTGQELRRQTIALADLR